jgi:hypothetical protein
MIDLFRANINQTYTPEKYQQFIAKIQNDCSNHIDFRVAETPVFIPKYLQLKLEDACEEIVKTIQSPQFLNASQQAIPSHLKVQNNHQHPHFICIDFAICQNKQGELEPQLIELQGFASMYRWMDYLANAYQELYPEIKALTPYLSGLTQSQYYNLLKETILGPYQAEEVILLELQPHQQKTRIDFYLTQQLLNIPIVCLSDLVQTEKKLFYPKDGKLFEVKRIYNRLIFDDLAAHPDFKFDIDLFGDLQVEWATHPNWFYRISKYSMPFLKHAFVPPTQFLSELKEVPKDLENYVLKPLFSFAGAGVIIDVKPEDITAIKDPENWILQKKVSYAEVIQTPEAKVKCEIRMMYLWPDKAQKPTLAISLTRLSRGKMIGVNYNKDLNWVGSSVSFFEK